MQLRQALEAQDVKYEYATLFSRLVTERSADDTALPMDSDPQGLTMQANLNVAGGSKQVGRAEMHEQRRDWESYVFTPSNVDEAVVRSYLDQIFVSKDAQSRLRILRTEVKDFGKKLLQSHQFDKEVMKWCVAGLLKTDLLSDEQSKALKEIERNPTYLSEMADVLNMRLASIETWTWGVEFIPLEMRRKLNGKYRVYMDEDISQALFLHFIGIKWAVLFKKGFCEFVESPAWERQTEMTKADRDRRSYFLGETPKTFGIEHERRLKYRTSYFMSQLANDEEEGVQGYSDDDVSSVADTTGAENTKENAVAIKQSLLHLLSADALVSNHLHGGLTVLQSDFRFFGPSLPHAVIFTALGFFGVSEIWIDFFKKFLEAPLKFIHDGPSSSIRTRKRGVPMSHALSDVFGEVMLFCLDYSVNQSTKGGLLYRLHDDFWFWGPSATCVDAWKTMKSFASTFGLDLNMEKTGASQITINQERPAPALPSTLPQTPIKWNFLTMEATAGRFVIDQSQIDIHIKEFRRQLDATRSTFAWIQAYNSYNQHFLNNFCQPAYCFGRTHVDDCLETLGKIHRELFPQSGGNVAEVIKTMIGKKFHVRGIPDGFVYLPMVMGGLELRNPFMSLQAMREPILEGDTDQEQSLEIWDSPMRRVEQAEEEDEEAYRRAKEKWEQTTVTGRDWQVVAHLPNDAPRDFMSWDEYTRFRWERSEAFRKAWDFLLQPVSEPDVEITLPVEGLIGKLPGKGLEAIRKNTAEMTSYWKGIVALYAEEMGGKFGGLAVVEKGLLPMGMVGLWKGGKIRWQG